MITEKRAYEIRQMIEKAVEQLSPEDSSTVPNLFPKWEIGIECRRGQKLECDGDVYEVLHTHISREEWYPENTLVYYSRISNLEETVLCPDGIPQWKEPVRLDEFYQKGDQVWFPVYSNGLIYTSLIDDNFLPPDTPDAWRVAK